MEKNQYLKIFRTVLMGFALLSALILLTGIEKVKAAEAIGLKPTDLGRINPGTEAPDFNLESVEKTWVKLSSYQNRKNVVLVFYRGYW